PSSLGRLGLTLVCCRHLFGIGLPPRVGFLLRVGFVLRAAVRRPPTRDVDGRRVVCGSVSGASRFLTGLVAPRRRGSCSLRPLTAPPHMALASLAGTQPGP